MQIPICPSAKGGAVNKANSTTGLYGGTNSYGMNHFFNNTNVTGGSISEPALAQPSSTLLIMDEDYYHAGPSFRDATGKVVASGQLKATRRTTGPPTAIWTRGPITARAVAAPTSAQKGA